MGGGSSGPRALPLYIILSATYIPHKGLHDPNTPILKSWRLLGAAVRGGVPAVRGGSAGVR